MYQVARGAKAQILPLSLEHALMTRTRPHHVGEVVWVGVGVGVGGWVGVKRERKRKCVCACVCVVLTSFPLRTRLLRRRGS